MMRRRAAKRNVGVPTSSMADIAFLLLTFFLVTTTVELDQGLEMQLPPEGQIRKVARENVAVIMLCADGHILLNDQRTPLSGLVSAASRLLGENPQLVFSIQSEAEAKYGLFIQVFDALRETTIERISILDRPL